MNLLTRSTPRLLALFCATLTAWDVNAGDDKSFVATGAPVVPTVDFLSSIPVIDGKLDDELRSLPVRSFNLVDKSSPHNPDTNANYRMAYGAEYFYLYIEADGAHLSYRDRAYQNGDGFNLLLTRPKADNSATDEFYVLAAGAVDEERLAWSRNIFWYHNVTNVFVKTSDDTRVEFAEANGKISFELYLPWRDVHPYHPWLSDEGIGFNLKLNKAIGDDNEMNSLDVYEGVIWEENSLREYNRLQFEAPASSSQSISQITRNTIKSGDLIEFQTVDMAPGGTEYTIQFEIRSGEGQRVLRASHRARSTAMLGKEVSTIQGSNRLPAGGYQVFWTSPYGSGSDYVSIIDYVDGGFAVSLQSAKSSISSSSLQTLEFYNQEILADLESKRTYETAAESRLKMATIENATKSAEDGVDVIAERRGYIRKGFRSRIDGTLQPYSVIIPSNYDASKEYPLVVFLHGSASDETTLGSARFISTDCCIAVAPFGRGYSNFFIGDEAQTDILEAIEAVMSAYAVDRDRIVITGFSMGGWGAIHTYAQNPDLFSAFAVFSAPPSVDVDDTNIDYGKQENQVGLKGARAFISWGTKDSWVPTEEVHSFTEKLREIGGEVELRAHDRGHAIPPDSDIRAYHDWLQRIVER